MPSNEHGLKRGELDQKGSPPSTFATDGVLSPAIDATTNLPVNMALQQISRQDMQTQGADFFKDRITRNVC
jgi:hypothetical protein